MRGRARGTEFGQGKARPEENCPRAELLVHEGTLNDTKKSGEKCSRRV